MNQKSAMEAVSIGDTARYAEIAKTSDLQFQQYRREYLEIMSRRNPSATEQEIKEAKLKYNQQWRSSNLIKNIGNQQIGTVGNLQIDREQVEAGINAIISPLADKKTAKSVAKLRIAATDILDKEKVKK